MLSRLSSCLLALAGIHCVAGAAMTTAASTRHDSWWTSNARDGIWYEEGQSSNNFFHSRSGTGETAPWWQLDMKRVHNVDSITIYNRQGACQSRLFTGLHCVDIAVGSSYTGPGEGANVGVSMSPCSGDVCPDFQLCGRITTKGASVKYTVDCAEGVKGRYVILQLPGTNRVINLQELEFEGAPITGPYSEFLAQNYDSASNVWRDSSGNGLDAEAMVGDFSVVTEADHGSTRNVTSVEGTAASSIKFGQGSIPPEFSICALTRYSHEASQARILTAVGKNWLLGHWSKNAGVAYFGAWKTRFQQGTRFGSTNWFVTCAQNDAYLTVNGYDQRTQNGGTGDDQMSINTYVTERSDFGIAALRIYDYHLDTAAMQDMEADFRRIIGQAPQPCDTVEGGNVAEGTECALPFTYRGETYNECTSVNNGDTKWCSTDATFAGNWGECCNVEQSLCTWSQINSQFAAGEADMQNGYNTLAEAQEACRLAPSVCQAVTCVPEGNWAYAGQCFLRRNAVLTTSAYQHQTYLPSPECSMDMPDPNIDYSGHQASGVYQNNDARGGPYYRSQLNSPSALSLDSRRDDGFLQLTLPCDADVYGVITQGRADASQWATTYDLQCDGVNSATGVTGNIDRSTAVVRLLPGVQTCSNVKIIIRSYYDFPSIRAGLVYKCKAAASQVDAGGASLGGSGSDGDDANGPSTPFSVTIDADDTVYRCGPDRYSVGCWKNVASDRSRWVHIFHADMPATSGEHDMVHTVDSGAGTFTVSDAGIDYQGGEKYFFPFTCLCDN